MTASMAGIVWSRVVSLDGPAKLRNSSTSLKSYVNQTGAADWRDMLYPVADSVTYVRPTLRRSPWLYVVLVIQPVLNIVMLLVAATLYSTPIDEDFGMISILSGVDRSSLDVLSGARLSGKLGHEVRLDIRPLVADEDDRENIRYELTPIPCSSKHVAGVMRRTLWK